MSEAVKLCVFCGAPKPTQLCVICGAYTVTPETHNLPFHKQPYMTEALKKQYKQFKSRKKVAKIPKVSKEEQTKFIGKCNAFLKKCEGDKNQSKEIRATTIPENRLS